MAQKEFNQKFDTLFVCLYMCTYYESNSSHDRKDTYTNFDSQEVKTKKIQTSSVI